LLHSRNAVFRVEDPTDQHETGGRLQRYVLRVHGPGTGEAAEIRSELLWLRALRRETDLAVPEPLATTGGDLVCRADTPGVPGARLCVLLRWMDGRFLYNVQPSRERLRRIGAFMACLHRHAERFEPPLGFVRDQQDASSLLGEWVTDPEARRRTLDRGAALLTTDDEALIERAVGRLRPAAEGLRPAPDVFGLIHADLHPANLLLHHGEVRAIDFDDCGFGYFAYDLGVLLTHVEEKHWPDQEGKRDALLEGYRSVRPFPDAQAALLPTFMALRRLGSVPWLVRMSTHPAMRRWVPLELAERLAGLRRYLDEE
jgi:Ser/Thr protein kinase RdoA (MazF antagonist)